ncbi:hypothetical protein NBRGN_070_00300 [Nocardia brasiliensis NBRC 14402]|uniref:hypothetical protein n=1 Tax=Nocardia brasiliensis TaxID=37326 RepID=UPI0003085F03|nr:hypothetical protein [Nocardia brasiliensis]ASF13390.1 hypothetical protein CEQ30_31680 [Nocardia brasiliensis]GAJ84225.1 hypothetical protein NBRGN_070_00300 [Nocardia brasiliensis NBRC 14402]SUB10161.1 Uncharacterised protein [Nocardia brasiliensis]
MARTGQTTTALRPSSIAEPAAADSPAALRVAFVREQFDPARLRLFARSSPGRLIAIGLLLIGLCVAAGWVTGATVGDRQQALNVLLDDTEPDSYSAHRLYTSLSIADAAASTAFIAGGLEPQTVRDRYTQAIGEAAAELVAQTGHSRGAGAGVADTTDTNLRIGIATRLPVYTGVIETARTNNRSGYPVGGAYLSEASNQMQTDVLPMAEELQNRRSAAVTEAQRNHVRPPWTAIVLLILALAALVWAQFDLAKRWRRVLNPGLLLASAAVVVLLVWTVVAGAISATSMIRARDDGAVPASRLTESRILAQQARSAETLKLARRDATGDYDRTFDANIARLADLLGGYPSSAPAAEDVRNAVPALSRWRVAHQRMNDTLARGDFNGAATVATGPGAADAAAQVEALDSALEKGIDKTRNTLRDKIFRAAWVLDFMGPGALLLGIVAAGCVGIGLWPRLREYR